MTNSTQPKTIDALVGLKRQLGEKLRKYAERYWEIYNAIENYDQQMVATSFKYGLDETSTIFEELMLNPPANMSRLIETVEKFVQREEIISERRLSRTSGN